MIFDFLQKKKKDKTQSSNKNRSENRFSIIFKKYKWYIFSLFLTFLFLFVIFKQIGIVLLLVTLGVLSRLYEKFLQLEWGIELVTMAVVLTTLAYSPFVGALTGIVSLTVSVIMNHPTEDPKYLPVSWIGLIACAYIVTLFSSFSLLSAGIIGTITYNLVIDPIFIGMGARFYKIVIFSATNILFNYFVFTTVAPFIFRLMT